MSAIVKHITPKLPTHIPVLRGASEELVTHRVLRSKYETNRDIKIWSCWFLLKALTTTGKIKCWYKQKQILLPYVQMNENTFRRRLKDLVQLQLITLNDDGSIELISYERAAGILDIAYTGVYYLQYNPEQNAGKQIFQYLLRCEEIRFAQERQLDGLLFHLDKNPSLKNSLHEMMVKAGADDQRLYKDREYYQKRLLQLQLHAFQEGTELLKFIFTHRADINRGVLSIQKAHCYKATTSVSYMKKRMFKLGLIQVNKVCVHSVQRSRLYIPDGNGRQKDGYKWIGAKKETALFLTDQITFTHEIPVKKKGQGRSSKAA